MRTTPCRGTEDDFNFLSAREASHSVVRNKFRLKTKVGEMLLNLATNEGTEETETLGFPCVDFDDFLKWEMLTINTRFVRVRTKN